MWSRARKGLWDSQTHPFLQLLFDNQRSCHLLVIQDIEIPIFVSPPPLHQDTGGKFGKEFITGWHDNNISCSSGTEWKISRTFLVISSQWLSPNKMYRQAAGLKWPFHDAQCQVRSVGACSLSKKNLHQMENVAAHQWKRVRLRKKKKKLWRFNW